MTRKKGIKLLRILISNSNLKIILFNKSQIQCAWSNIAYTSSTQLMLAGALDDCRKAVKWATDYILKVNTATNEFYGQVGRGNLDHDFWWRPEDMTMLRPAFKFGTSKPGKLASRSFFPSSQSQLSSAQSTSCAKYLRHSKFWHLNPNKIHRRCDSTTFILYVFFLRHLGTEFTNVL